MVITAVIVLNKIVLFEMNAKHLCSSSLDTDLNQFFTVVLTRLRNKMINSKQLKLFLLAQNISSFYLTLNRCKKIHRSENMRKEVVSKFLE